MHEDMAAEARVLYQRINKDTARLIEITQGVLAEGTARAAWANQIGAELGYVWRLARAPEIRSSQERRAL